MLPGVMADDQLDERYTAILEEARARVAAREELDAASLDDRLRAVGGGAPQERAALQQLERVLAIQRARTRLAQQPARPVAGAAPVRRRSALRTRPTISGNMDVRRQRRGQTPILSWEPSSGVTSWDVRFSERPDSRSDYAVRDELNLPGTATNIEVTLGERTMRIHLLGRGRDGRLVRRAIISGLTEESWNDRWERRASAS